MDFSKWGVGTVVRVIPTKTKSRLGLAGRTPRPVRAGLFARFPTAVHAAAPSRASRSRL